MGHINQLAWVPAANIQSILKWFLCLFSDFAAIVDWWQNFTNFHCRGDGMLAAGIHVSWLIW